MNIKESKLGKIIREEISKVLDGRVQNKPDSRQRRSRVKKAARKMIGESDTLRSRAQSAQSKDELLDVFKEMAGYMDGKEFLRSVTQAMSRDGLSQSIQYIDRQHNFPHRRETTYRQEAESASMDELISMADRMGTLMGDEKLANEIAMSMGRSSLRNLIQYIDRQYDLTPVRA